MPVLHFGLICDDLFMQVSSFVCHEVRQSYVLRTVSPRITKFYTDIHASLLYTHTGYDLIKYFMSEVIAKN